MEKNLFARLLVSLIFLSNQLYSQPVLGYTPYITGLSSPVDIANAHDGSGRLFIVEQGGRIRIFKDSVRAAPFLDVRSLITFSDERGLLSLAFHPRFDTNHYFFIWYASTAGSITTVHLARYRARIDDPNRADSLSGVVLLSINKPSGRTNHNGAKLNFGPDGMLYFGTGDGGSGNDPDNLAQNGDTLLGKMLRINVDSFYSSPPYYTIPPDNPYVSTSGVRPEIYDMGLRNPWRWSFDTIGHSMWIADVGQNTREEVDMLPFANTSGANYGWRCYEGFIRTPGVTVCDPPNYVPPIFDYTHDPTTGGSAIIGGYVYRGSQYPNLYGYYICADLSSGNAWTILPDGSGGSFSTRQSGFAGTITSFGTDESGELFMAAESNTIFKISGSFPLPLTLQNLEAKSFAEYNELRWETLSENNTDHFDVEYGFDGRNYVVAGSIKASGNSNGKSYVFHHDIQMNGKVFYRLRIVDHDGGGKYSPVVIVSPLNKKMELALYPTIVNNQQFNINSSAAINEINIFNGTGIVILHKQIGGASGYFTINLPSLPAGIYWVKITGDYERIIKQVVVQ